MKFREGLVLAGTGARVIHGYRHSKKILKGESIVGPSLSIMGIDIADGVVSRMLGVDGPRRRAADSIADSAIISLGLLATFKANKKTRPYVAALAARESFIGLGWAYDLGKTKQVKKGDDFHKLPSVSIAAFCMAASTGNGKAMKAAGITAVAVNAALAYDYYRGWKSPDNNTVLDTGVHEVPGFYDARVKLREISLDQTQLGSGVEPLQIAPESTEPFIDVTCIEIKE